jgi:hypothetical protein
MIRCILGLVVILSVCGNNLMASGEVPEGYKVVYEQDFSQEESLAHFEFTDPKVWKFGKTAQGRTYIEHVARSQYKYKVRSPYNIALLKKLKVKSFVLEMNMQQTGKEYGHRDMCVFYNVIDRSHFYYTHIASATDTHAHNIFIVNDKPRTAISLTTSKGHQWGKAWHKVRIVRDADKGTIEVYINDMNTPIMTAEDTTFGWGYVGFGSFDDTGRISDLKVWAAESRPGESGSAVFTE